MGKAEPKGTGGLYSALAVLNLASVLAGVLLCHQLVGSYQDAVEINRSWARRSARVSELSRAATVANGPGNDVFDTRDVTTERARLREFSADYARLDLAARPELAHLPEPQRASLSSALDHARDAFAAMMSEAEAMFVAFERDDQLEAGQHMASMNRHLAATGRALAYWSQIASEFQQQSLAEQAAQAARLGRWAWMLVAAVALLVALAVGYGRLLSRRFAEAAAAIAARNADMQRLLDHASQGFATIDLHGQLSRERSAMFETLLRASPSQTDIDTVLRAELPQVADWMRIGLEALRDGNLPVELCIDQLPKRCVLAERHISLEYRAIPSHAPQSLLLVASDITPQIEREALEEQQRETAQVFARAMSDRDGVIEFLAEAGAIVRVLAEARCDLDEERRLLHTLKGNAALFALQSLARFCHALEDTQAETGQPLAADERQQLAQTWEAIVSRLRALLGEERTHLIQVDERELADIIECALAGQAGAQLASRLQSFRLELAARRLERVGEQARAFARRIGKPDLRVELEPNGVRMSRERWGKLWTSLVHVVRNAIDHGIEPAEEREGQGKPPGGQLRLSTRVASGRLEIAIADDGRGIDWTQVRARAQRLQMPSATQDELVAALFAQGFSTREVANENSGRGVGLSAVSQALLEVGGSVEIETALGRGSTFYFILPYSDAEVALRASLRPAAGASAA